MKRFLASLMLATCVGSAHAEPAWQSLSYSDPRHPGPMDVVTLPLWRHELANAPFYQMQATRIDAGPASYLVTLVLGAGLCSTGPNDKNAVAEPAICPVRVDVIQNGSVVRTIRGKACSVVPLPEDGTSDQTDVTQVRLDEAGQSIEFRSRMRKKWLRRCQVRVRVPQTFAPQRLIGLSVLVLD